MSDRKSRKKGSSLYRKKPTAASASNPLSSKGVQFKEVKETWLQRWFTGPNPIFNPVEYKWQPTATRKYLALGAYLSFVVISTSVIWHFRNEAVRECEKEAIVPKKKNLDKLLESRELND